MQIQEAVEVCVAQKYADFEGVATRSELWFFYLFLVVILVLTGLSVPVLTGIFALSMAVPAIAVGSRRLHDTGRSAWWLLLAGIPAVGTLVLLAMFVQSGRKTPAPFGATTPT